jgi:hypothetical protein
VVVVELDVQALVEMKNLDDAIALYEFAKNNSLLLHNSPMNVNYSVHKRLQRNPLDYTPCHILLVTICGCSDFPLSLFQMASVGMTP